LPSGEPLILGSTARKALGREVLQPDRSRGLVTKPKLGRARPKPRQVVFGGIVGVLKGPPDGTVPGAGSAAKAFKSPRPRVGAAGRRLLKDSMNGGKVDF